MQVPFAMNEGHDTASTCVLTLCLRVETLFSLCPSSTNGMDVCFFFAHQKRDFEHNGQNYDIAILGKNKGGGFLIKTPNDNVAIALYDEEKEQNKADALTTALNFADYLYQGGF